LKSKYFICIFGYIYRKVIKSIHVKKIYIENGKNYTNNKQQKMGQNFTFIYAKNGKIKALDIEKAKNMQNELFKDGWIHTKTLDACLYIQYLHNECEGNDLIEEIQSLNNNEA
jgi:hypothetical protein